MLFLAAAIETPNSFNENAFYYFLSKFKPKFCLRLCSKHVWKHQLRFLKKKYITLKILTKNFLETRSN
jgi:hypothetical protein